jgi:SAM-dependent methyltransferase
MIGMYENQKARRTLDPKYMTEYLRQAQCAEFAGLKKVIIELYEIKGSPINVLDIGVGEARVPVNLAEIPEIWNCIRRYSGIDNVYGILRVAEKNVREKNLSDKVSIRFNDARDLGWKVHDFPGLRYDLVLCTYFTACNLALPDSYSFTENANVDDSDIKSAFQRVFRPAYDLLRPSGKLVLGSVYKDNESTAAKQREFYEKCGMTVISRPSDPFTATKEGFWSLRFSEERVRDLFDWVNHEKIQLIDLDDYDFAMMVIISKN